MTTSMPSLPRGRGLPLPLRRLPWLHLHPLRHDGLAASLGKRGARSRIHVAQWRGKLLAGSRGSGPVALPSEDGGLVVGCT
eukprot:10022683-Alexandrium_andersonii.AAC.1